MSKLHGLEALMHWRARPEGKPEPVKTNWTVVPSNDNASPEEIADYSFERHLRVTPSVEVIMENVATGDVVTNAVGQTVQIGRLRFSDGKQTERAYANGPDGKLVQFDARMPVGAMMGAKEKAEAQAGGSGLSQIAIANSNFYFADMFGVDYASLSRAKRTARRNGKACTAAESAVALAAAYANTPTLPPVKVYPAGLPCASPRVAESFLGMRKTSGAPGGGIAWEDLATSIVNREIWDETLAHLAKRDVQTLDAAMTARTLADIAPGGTDRGARKRGKRLLYAANDNLAVALKNAAA